MLALSLGRGLSLTALTALFLLFSPFFPSPVAFAQFPIAQPGTEGSEVIVNSTSPVIATYQGNSALYSNDLYLVVDGDPAHDRFILNNHETPVGSTVTLGSFPVGTTLLFRLHVRNTGKDYFTGPASRNPDNKPHARAQANWKPNETLVSFEDLFNGPFNYHDLSFSFIATTAIPSAPDLMPTVILYNPLDLVPGKTVLFDAGVQNTGGQGTGVFNVRWSVDGVSVGYGRHEGVPASTTLRNGTSQFSWMALAGTHTIMFTVDVDNHVVEANEANNSIAVTVAVQPGLSPGWYRNSGPVTIYEGSPK
jgi:hypothetical protein